MIPSFGPVAGQMVGDAVTHEHDIRDALGAPGARDSDAVHIGSHWMANAHGRRSTATPATARCAIETDLWSETFGDDAPATTLRASAFERAAGRHRPAQHRADRRRSSWDGTARPELVVMPIFVPRAEDFDG